MQVIAYLLTILCSLELGVISFGQIDATNAAMQHGSADEKVGVKCVLQMLSQEQYKGQKLPAFQISVAATKTNQLGRVWTSYSTNYLEVDLLKPDGSSALRTSLGSNYVVFPTSQQVKTVFERAVRESRRDAFRSFRMIKAISSPDRTALIHITTFSLPELFNLEVGEYTLKVRMRLLEEQVDKFGNVQFGTVVLPEVAARIQVSSKITHFQQWNK